MSDQKNLILAIVLSVLIIVGFQVFFAPPVPPPAPAPTIETTAPAETASSGTVATGSGTGVPVGAVGETGVVAIPRDMAIAGTPRVEIRTTRVHGSINLQGGRIDDLTLSDYRETVNLTSPAIVLLSPRNAPSPYYVDVGWTPTDPAVAVPGADTLWTAEGGPLTDKAPVTLRWDNGEGLVFTRRISIDANYMFTIEQIVENRSGAAVALAPYARSVRVGQPVTEGFFILHEGPYGVFQGTLDELGYDDVIEAPGGIVDNQTTGGWLGYTDKYWLVALVPDQAVAVDAQFVHTAPDGTDRFLAAWKSETVTIAPGASVTSTSRIFAGAKEVALIDAYERDLGIEKFELTVDFGWFYFLTKPFFYALAFIHGIVGNFGIAILIFTVALKLLFFPLANKSYVSMSKMKALQPEMTRLRERFGDDRQKLNMEMMALYKREKVNPASGCLPILIQIPVFFALYKVLFVTIEMRHAPFYGWIRDLSAPDPTTIFNLFGLIPWDPPAFLMIGVWPLIMGLTMFLQQKLNPPPADPIQARIFMALPIVFTFMLAAFPAGLVIYWAWNNALSILQQWVIMRRMGVKIGGGVDRKDSAAAKIADRAHREQPETQEGKAGEQAAAAIRRRKKA